jgi:hypothetical protein
MRGRIEDFGGARWVDGPWLHANVVAPLASLRSAVFLLRGKSTLFAALVALTAGCARADDLSPLASFPDAGDAGDEEAQPDAAEDAPPDVVEEEDPTLGRPCGEDDPCDDGVPCTVDLCDPEIGRCRNTPDDASCADGRTCNGKEICDPALGCRLGPPLTCSDDDTCTLDRCDELDGCQHLPRDADGDGSPDVHCVEEGGDCNDTDPAISPSATEICGNGIDDDCDGTIDEEECSLPSHDTCSDPLVLDGPGTYKLGTAGAKLDVGATCVPATSTGMRDVVAAVKIPDGPPLRLDAIATVSSGSVSVQLSTQCGEPSTEVACATSYPVSGALLAHARAHSLPPGTYPIVLYTPSDAIVTLKVELSPADAAPTNETCGTAIELVPGEPTLVPLVGSAPDLPSTCGGASSDLVYRVDLEEQKDVRAVATLDGDGTVTVSIRRDPCAELADEVSCGRGSPGAAFARRLGPGPVFIAVKTGLAADASLLVTLEPPTDPPPDETCDGAPPLEVGKDVVLDLTDHQDDVADCAPGYVDAAYTLTLGETSDVLLLLDPSNTDVGALSLYRPGCEKADLVACRSPASGLLRVVQHGLPAGDYRAVVELADAAPSRLYAAVRPAVAPVWVPFADTCEEAFVLPPAGGTFQGNTANAYAQYSAGCDQGGLGPFGAPEQMLRLDLPAKKRVLLDLTSSGYPTLIDVRKGPSCPGPEVLHGCTIGNGYQQSFLDLTLDPGTYFLQMDGYDGHSGEWTLDVFVLDP